MTPWRRLVVSFFSFVLLFCFSLGAKIQENNQSSEATELETILGKAAAYCEKLKISAFHFTCLEQLIQETLKKQTGLSGNPNYNYDRATWLYDYQIIGEAEKITEKRVLLRRNRQKLNEENAQLETRFRSFYSYYLPVTLLGGDKQSDFVYELVKKEKLKKRPVAYLRITPQKKEGAIISGEAWVDLDNGAVLKISLDQSSIKGIAALEQNASQSGARLVVNDVHWYEVEQRGIHFPSETNIFERYITNVRKPVYSAKTDNQGRGGQSIKDVDFAVTRGSNQLEVSRTYVTYSDYKFFKVEVGVASENIKE